MSDELGRAQAAVELARRYATAAKMHASARDVAIRRAVGAGHSYRTVARAIGMSHQAVAAIVHRGKA